jgi:hypothetical protein
MRRRDTGRRRALLTLGGLGAVLATQPARAASDAPAEIVQPAQPTGDAFMRRAFEMRRLTIERGDQPCGAVMAGVGGSSARA